MEVVEVKSCFVGIDVSKKVLDICILPSKSRFQVENNGDFEELCQPLTAISPTLIVMEATGGYEDGCYRALNAAGFRVSREPAINLPDYRE